MRNSLLYLKFASQYAIENRTLKHIKQFNRWHKDTSSSDSTLSRQLPWMTYDAIAFLERTVTPEMNIFEWGSGGSTLFFAKHCKNVVSIEHDTKWSETLSEIIKHDSIKNITLKNITPQRVSDDSQMNSQPSSNNFLSSAKKFKNYSFESYVKAIDEYEDNYFDIIVVDGRARSSCIKRAILHLKTGGHLIVDNSERKNYLAPFPELQNDALWKKQEFEGPVFFQHAFTRTSFFKKK